MREVDLLLCDLKSTKWETSTKAARELRRFHTPEVVKALIVALTQKEDLWLAIGAAKTLGEFADPTTVEALESVLLSTSLEEEMQNTVRQLIAKGDKAGAFYFGGEYGSEIVAFKVAISTALFRIGTEEAREALEKAKIREDKYHITRRAIEMAERNLEGK